MVARCVSGFKLNRPAGRLVHERDILLNYLRFGKRMFDIICSKNGIKKLYFGVDIYLVNISRLIITIIKVEKITAAVVIIRFKTLEDYPFIIDINICFIDDL